MENLPRQFIPLCIAILAWSTCLAQTPSSLVNDDKAQAVRMQAHVAKIAKKSAVAIESLNADGNFRGFDVVASRLGRFRLLGLGESTHGTHEFNRFRAKLFQYLAMKHGFTHFFLEDMAFATAPLDGYVQGLGVDDPKGTMNGLMWPWATEDMIEFLRWARAYNANQKDVARRIHILGVDIQKPYQQSLHLADLMRKTHQPTTETDTLAKIAEGMPKANLRNWRQIRVELAMLEQRLGETLPAELAGLLRAIGHGADLELAPGEDAIRDRGMAMQLLDALKRIPPESKAIWWAHNAHVSHGPAEAFPWAGSHLRTHLGDQYGVIGCFTREGTLTSQDARILAKHKNPDGGFTPGMPPVLPGPMAFRFPDAFFEGILARRMDQGVVFMEDLRRDPACQRYLATRSIECSGVGTPFDPSLCNDERMPFIPDAFDALFFIRKSTAAANAKYPGGSKPAN